VPGAVCWLVKPIDGRILAWEGETEDCDVILNRFVVVSRVLRDCGYLVALDTLVQPLPLLANGVLAEQD